MDVGQKYALPIPIIRVLAELFKFTTPHVLIIWNLLGSQFCCQGVGHLLKRVKEDCAGLFGAQHS